MKHVCFLFRLLIFDGSVVCRLFIVWSCLLIILGLWIIVNWKVFFDYLGMHEYNKAVHCLWGWCVCACDKHMVVIFFRIVFPHDIAKGVLWFCSPHKVASNPGFSEDRVARCRQLFNMIVPVCPILVCSGNKLLLGADITNKWTACALVENGGTIQMTVVWYNSAQWAQSWC